MYEMMLNRKHNRKGFTLVEVIVVLVILAILAAIMIPSMVKWIDEANAKKGIVEARTILLAAQTIASEAYGTDTPVLSVTDADVKKFLGATESASLGTVTDITVTAGVCQTFTYTPKNGGKAVTYTPGSGFSVAS